jgi:RTX calcium-binding nonapeptide repeat (4 copies)
VTRLRSALEMSRSIPKVRLRLADFFSRLWLEFPWRALSLPVPVLLKRFFAPECDFIFGIRVGQYRGMRPPLALVALAIALLVPASARADSVTYGIGSLVYTGEEVRDQVTIAREGSNLLLSAEAGDTLSAPGVCTRRGANSVSCPQGPSTAVNVDLRGGDDALTVTLPDAPALSVVASGGAGNDVLDASAAAAGALRGDAGNDRLLAGRGAFDLTGGTGNDELAGGPAGSRTRFLADPAPDGADRLLGGPGADSADYSARTAAVRLTADGVADDGATGEGDNIAPAVETLVGGSGADVLAGAPGPSVLTAMAGDDQLQARDDAADQVDCGDGTDVAVLDAADVTNACETEQRPAPPAPPTVTIKGLPRSTTWTRLRRGLRFEVTPSAPARWVFTLLGERRGSRTLTRRTLPLFAGPRTVTLKPTAKRLGARRRLTLRVRITAVAAGGQKTLVIRRVRVRP